MDKKMYISVLLISLFLSCKENGNETDFPNSVVNNFNIPEDSLSFLTKVRKLNNGKYRIESPDTLITKLDSTLHLKILDLQSRNSRHHQNVNVRFELDKDLPFKEFRDLTDEFRKANFQSFILQTQGKGDLSVRLLPYFPIGDSVVDSIQENFIRSFDITKSVTVGIQNGQLTLYDNRGNEINDYIKYALEHKKFITYYDLKENQTYQDFVTLYSQLVEWHEKLKIIIDGDEGKSNSIENYKFLILEKTHHNII